MITPFKHLLALLPLILMSQTVLAASAPTPGVVKPNMVKTSVSKAKGVPKALAPQELPLGADELAIAQRVYQGRFPCELGASLSVAADTQAPGYFDVQVKSQRFHMAPVATSTGAIRLEDRKLGIVLLQLGNKTMLMNQKLGQRLADACVSPEQILLAEQIKNAPPPSLFEQPAAVAAK